MGSEGDRRSLGKTIVGSLGVFARDVETERFVVMVRNTVLVGFVLVTSSEVAAYIWPEFPRDPIGTGIMAGSFLAVAMVCFFTTSRALVGTLSVLLFGVLGWYVARAISDSGGLYSLHRDAIYSCLAAAHALLLFSAIEFTAVTILFSGTLVATLAYRSDVVVGDLFLTGFYVLSFYAMALVGITARARLKRSEKRALGELERLNRTLQSEVSSQVERIRRAEVLGRYLPPELSEQVMGSDDSDQLGHGRREVAVLCASPVGFLETMTALETDDVVPLVNSFVSTMSRVAFEHGGVIERFVGPRITVLFGSLAAVELATSVRHAVEMARDIQRSCNVLLRQWEHEGLTIKLRMAIGIAAGPSVVGTFGSERRVEYSALGEAMVRAHRLTATAIPGEIRLDRSAAVWLDHAEVVAGEAVEFAPGKPEATYVLDVHRGETAAEDSPPAIEPDEPDEESSMEAALLATSMARPPTGPATGNDSTILPAVNASPGRSIAPPPLLETGSLFDGRYRIEGRIGRGGTATVYRARHVALDQPRALKLIHPEQLAAPGAVEQFRREAEATSRIHHPNVVQLHDFGRSVEGHYYLALDFVEGESLAAVLGREGRLELSRALHYARGMLEALQAAHELRLIHRDLKPGNVLIDRHDAVRVTDFGMAQPLHASHGGEETIAGTPAFMSPEQCQGSPLDGRSDLYSFGITLYQMLSDNLPYRDLSGDPFTLALSSDRVPLAERAPELPTAICSLVERCLARQPADRPSSALAILRLLDVDALTTETARRSS